MKKGKIILKNNLLSSPILVQKNLFNAIENAAIIETYPMMCRT